MYCLKYSSLLSSILLSFQFNIILHYIQETTETTTQTADDQPTTSSSSSDSDKRLKPNKETLPKKKLKNKQIHKILKSEKQQAQRLHKERSEAEQCPTCGLKFSKKADRRVIEEHLVFHDRVKKDRENMTYIN